ncbi:hypothetical protein G9C85_02490 [Halorubellus sp. JP-L1]|uniref:hypothetical protein n=1 Tax=Halorubellus sp. JP-L1 TaxID=2715753 RepID=UPI00140D07FA|nr:hypothetical protein [Halorubellus sp. JP-L1]NHN40506.1 hypothetical protein [Halorubellus sp. JP-L1]
MSLERFEHAQELVEGAMQGPESHEPGLRLRLCHARSRLACLSDSERGTPITRERWLQEADEFLQEADTLATHEGITNTIRDAQQLLKDPVICERATRIHADGGQHDAE